jgi:hypothetical protein
MLPAAAAAAGFIVPKEDEERDGLLGVIEDANRQGRAVGSFLPDAHPDDVSPIIIVQFPHAGMQERRNAGRAGRMTHHIFSAWVDALISDDAF